MSVFSVNVIMTLIISFTVEPSRSLWILSSSVNSSFSFKFSFFFLCVLTAVCWLFSSICLGFCVLFQSQAVSSRNLSTYWQTDSLCSPPCHLAMSFHKQARNSLYFSPELTFCSCISRFILTSFLPTLRRTSCNETVDGKSLSSLSIVFQLLGCCWEMQNLIPHPLSMSSPITF